MGLAPSCLAWKLPAMTMRTLSLPIARDKTLFLFMEPNAVLCTQKVRLH